MLIIYENTGKVIATMSGEYTAPACIVAEVPDNKEVDFVDIETGEVVLKDRPKTDAERIAELEEQVEANNAYLEMLAMEDAEV